MAGASKHAGRKETPGSTLRLLRAIDHDNRTQYFWKSEQILSKLEKNLPVVEKLKLIREAATTFLYESEESAVHESSCWGSKYTVPYGFSNQRRRIMKKLASVIKGISGITIAAQDKKSYEYWLGSPEMFMKFWSPGCQNKVSIPREKALQTNLRRAIKDVQRMQEFYIHAYDADPPSLCAYDNA